MLYNRDWQTEVSRGRIPGAIRLNKSGLNNDVDTAAGEDVWDGGGDWTEPTADRIHAIVSSAVTDTSLGAGARTVFIRGISGGNITTETVTLNGASPVNTVNAYSIIDYMYVATAGGGTNDGAITATAATDGTVTARINVDGTNQTQMCITKVPTGYSYYIYNWECEMYNSNASSSAEISLQTKFSGGVWLTRRVSYLSNSGDSHKMETFDPPLVIPSGALVKIRCTSVTNNNTKVSGYFNGVLILD